MAVHPLVLNSKDLRILEEEGDAVALETLYRNYATPLLKFCRGRLGDATEAEDAALEALMRLHAALPGSRPGPVWPWLVTIARNICTDIKRNRARIAAWDEPSRERLASDIEGDPEEEVAHRIRKQLLDEAMQSLPGRYRSFVRLRDFDGWSYEEIARLHGVSIASVRSVLLRARRSLKKEVETLARAKGQWPLPAVLPGAWNRMRSLLHEWRNSIQTATTEALVRFGNLVGIESVVGLLPRLGEAALAAALAASMIIGAKPQDPQQMIPVNWKTGPAPASISEEASPHTQDPPAQVEVIPPSTSTSKHGGTVYKGPSVSGSIDSGSEDREDFALEVGPVFVTCPPEERRGIVKSAICPVLDEL